MSRTRPTSASPPARRGCRSGAATSTRTRVSSSWPTPCIRPIGSPTAWSCTASLTLNGAAGYIVRTNPLVHLMQRLRFAAVLVAAFALTASAQTYPNKPVRVLLGFPVGQATDVLARLVAAKLSSQYGQQFYVENRPGAAGIIATELAAKAEPDGYTLLASSSGPLAVNPTLYPKLPYDVARDFVVFAG